MAGQTGVRLITVPSIDWENYLKDIAELTGHSPISFIDKSNIKWEDLAKYLISLGEFHANCEPYDSLKTDALLMHLSFSFLIDSPTVIIFKIMELTDLNVISAKRTSQGRVAIISGNLKQWKDAVVIVLRSKRSYDLNWIFKECHQVFCELGLMAVWHDYRKKPCGLTYLLEYKQ